MDQFKHLPWQTLPTTQCQPFSNTYVRENYKSTMALLPQGRCKGESSSAWIPRCSSCFSELGYVLTIIFTHYPPLGKLFTPLLPPANLSHEKILQQHIQLYFFIPSSKGFHQALKQVRILSLREHWQRPPCVRLTFPNPHTMGRIYCREKALVGISNSAVQIGGNRLTASEALRALILHYLVIPINISSAQWKLI